MKTHIHNTLDYLHTLLKLSPYLYWIFPTDFYFLIKALKTTNPLNLEARKEPHYPMKGSSKKLSKIVTNWKRRGHFVVYSKDNNPFLVPLCYLKQPIFRVLLEMAEEEYGLTFHGPLRIPCEKEFVEFILCLLRRNGAEEVEKAVLSRGKAAFWGGEQGDTLSPVLSYNLSRICSSSKV